MSYQTAKIKAWILEVVKVQFGQTQGNAHSYVYKPIILDHFRLIEEIMEF